MIVKLPLVNGCIDCGVGSTIPSREKSKVTVFLPKEIGLNATPSGPLFSHKVQTAVNFILIKSFEANCSGYPTHIFMFSSTSLREMLIGEELTNLD